MSDNLQAIDVVTSHYEATDHKRALSSSSSWFDNPWLDRTVNNIRVRDSLGREHLLTERVSPEYSVAISHSIHRLRSAIDLPIAWLARILRVERQTIYAWMREATLSTTAPRPGNAQRISELQGIGEQWRMRTGSRLSRKHAVLCYQNRSLLDWLEESDLKDANLAAALRAFSQMERTHELIKPLSRRLYRAEAHPDAHRERFMESSSVLEPKE